MTTATGKWSIILHSPLGKQEGSLLVESDTPEFVGTLTAMGQPFPCQNGSAEDGHIAFNIVIEQPIAMNLRFDLDIEGDSLTGEAKAGVFPKQKVTGERV